LMKPLDRARLADACRRVRERLIDAPARLDALLELLARQTTQARKFLRWINASSGQDVRLITVEEVCYFQSDTKYTRAVTAESESLIRKSLKELLDELDPEVFWQIHRSTVVNVSAIAAVTRDFSGRLMVKLKHRKEALPVSQPFAHLFRQM
ncbi:MAG TPA: LytTR family DNA-binding domain-containing protein, partial [Burkholderiales bacterium]|nr:LytTR family DNA-binding domain-containing protein [Burkholderiales bacterium]